MRKRGGTRKTWLDYIATMSITGAAAGTIVRHDLVSETNVEELFGSDATIVRVVGDIFCHATLGSPRVFFQLWGGQLPSPYLTTGLVTLDDLMDPRTMWTRGWSSSGTSTDIANPYIPVDVKSKRRLRANSMLALFAFDWSATAGSNFLVYMHLRTLVVHG